MDLSGELTIFLASKDLDRGSTYAAQFLLNLLRAVDVSTFSYQVQDETTLLITAQLERSRKVLKLRFFFGPTDVLTPSQPPQHWRLTSDALINDDIVVYNGHTGLGENFKPDNIRNEAKVSSIASSHPILLAILSCYSFYYYGDQFLALPGQKPKSMQLVETGSPYTSYRGPLGILQEVDFALAGKPEDLPLVNKTDFLILLNGKK